MSEFKEINVLAFQEKTGKEFNTYYAKYYPKLVWIIQRMNINKIDAEDLANMAFIRTLEKIDIYDKKYHYSTWLFDIGKKMAFQFMKDRAKLVCVDTSKSSDDEDYSSYQYYLNNEIDTFNDTIDNEEMHNVKYKETLKEIAKLSGKYKEIIELCDIHGYSYLDIVDMTGESLQTIKNRLHHGRKKIKTNLENKFEYILDNY
jgi:RNA polymerase sigma-70 factor, ECF subfamily